MIMLLLLPLQEAATGNLGARMLQPYLMPLLPVIQGKETGQMRGVKYHRHVTKQEITTPIPGDLLKDAGR